MKESSVKEQIEESESKKEVLGSIKTSSSGSPTVSAEDRIGIERAFDVIRHHTVHTKSYVMIALKLIEEFGDSNDKAELAALLQQKKEPVGTKVIAKKKAVKKR